MFIQITRELRSRLIVVPVGRPEARQLLFLFLHTGRELVSSACWSRRWACMRCTVCSEVECARRHFLSRSYSWSHSGPCRPCTDPTNTHTSSQALPAIPQHTHLVADELLDRVCRNNDGVTFAWWIARLVEWQDCSICSWFSASIFVSARPFLLQGMRSTHSSISWLMLWVIGAADKWTDSFSISCGGVCVCHASCGVLCHKVQKQTETENDMLSNSMARG